MMQELQTQAKVSIGLDALWNALTKDLRFVAPKVMPKLIKNVELIEGDGGLGTVLLFKFESDISPMTDQKEKIVEFDDSLHHISLQVIEGGCLNAGFSSYKTTVTLTAAGDQETLVDVKVSYESETEESTKTSKTTESTLHFLKCLETYFLNGAS